MSEARSREDLFDLLKFDHARPEQAEAEAARRGWAPLAAEPDPAKFDPMTEPQWTLVMAMAWIATRSVDAVRLMWNKYRAEYPVWRRKEWRDGPGGKVFKGWLLYFLEPATSLGLELLVVIEGMKEDGRLVVMSATGARDALWEALQEGLLPATGKVRQGGDRVTIPAEEWQSLLPRSEHRDEVGRQSAQADYVEPLVPARAVRHLWPPRREPAKLPPLVCQCGNGFMPLYCAAQWIATRGGAYQFDPEDVTVWQEVFSELLAAISSDRVRVTGLRDGEVDLIPGHKFAGCQVDYPHSDAPMDLMASEDVYLRSHPYVNEERWRNGIDDALVNRHGSLWKQLMVEKESVRERWPFGFSPRSKSGLPGRPTSKHLIMRELERRFAAGMMLPSVGKEAGALWDWLRLTHSDDPPGTAKTIENQIRARHRELRAPK